MGHVNPRDGYRVFSGILSRFSRDNINRTSRYTPLIIRMDFGDHFAHADIKFWFMILLVVNLQTSFLTPPFGFALFYMKGIALKEIQIQSIYKGMIPFVILQALGVVSVMAFPEVALWLMHAACD